MSIAGKRILYTGAAGGLGAPATLHFLDAGATVIAADHSRDKLDALAAAVPADARARLVALHTDLSDLARFRADLDGVLADIGGIDVVINNAAIYPSKRFEDYAIEEHQAVQRVNVDAGIVAVQAALSGMKQRQWGRILNIASVTTYGGWALLSPYVASKGALIGLTRAWACEFGGDGITVNAVSPGAFPTDAEKIHPDPDGYARFVLDHQAVKRRGAPADIARALAFLASDDAGFITGQTLNVDGGWIMH
jgi:3-oxoacyl-[acyl-carrier protein] reductase